MGAESFLVFTENIPVCVVLLFFCSVTVCVLDTEVSCLLVVYLLRKENMNYNLVSVLPSALSSSASISGAAQCSCSLQWSPLLLQPWQSVCAGITAPSLGSTADHTANAWLCSAGVEHNLLIRAKVNTMGTCCLRPFQFVFLFPEMNQQRN